MQIAILILGIQCAPLSTWDGLVVNDTSQQHLSTVNVTCGAEWRTESNHNIHDGTIHTCNHLAEWTPPIPHCIRKCTIGFKLVCAVCALVCAPVCIPVCPSVCALVCRLVCTCTIVCIFNTITSYLFTTAS